VDMAGLDGGRSAGRSQAHHLHLAELAALLQALTRAGAVYANRPTKHLASDVPSALPPRWSLPSPDRRRRVGGGDRVLRALRGLSAGSIGRSGSKGRSAVRRDSLPAARGVLLVGVAQEETTSPPPGIAPAPAGRKAGRRRSLSVPTKHSRPETGLSESNVTSVWPWRRRPAPRPGPAVDGADAMPS